jgi:hypothetical protein
MARGGCLRLTSTGASRTTKTLDLSFEGNCVLCCAASLSGVRIGVALPVSRSVTVGLSI